MSSEIFPSKVVEELAPYVVNFSDKLQFGEVINGAGITVSVHSGIDPNPGAMLSGYATYDSAGNVTQNITGGLPGVIYNLAYVCTADGSHNYVKVIKLAVLAAESL